MYTHMVAGYLEQKNITIYCDNERLDTIVICDNVISVAGRHSRHYFNSIREAFNAIISGEIN